MNLKKTKMVQGLFVILVMLHHLSQKTSASWVPAKVRQPGLEIFVPIGYLLVSYFFFSSGYGLAKSRREKQNYFDGFLVRRLNPILLTFCLTNLIYLEVRFVCRNNVYLPINPYSWYVYTIMILYAGFFLIYRKERKHPVLLMSLVILAYSIYCYVEILGDWWINSPPVFLLGILFAENEEKLQRIINTKKKTVRAVITLAVIFAVCFAATERCGDIYNLLKRLIPGMAISYYLINIPCIILQAVAGSCISILIYILLPYINPGKRVESILGFFGAMTLEFYLIHGIFVQLFGHHFIDDKTKPVLYIKNVFLYVIVVFILSTISAFLIKKLCSIISDFYDHTPMFKKVFRDMLKGAAFVAAAFVVLTIVYSSYRHKLSESLESKLESFRDKNITYVDVNGTKVSTLLEGSGRYTVVILGSDEDPCPTMDYRPLTERLLSKTDPDSGSELFRTIIIDYPGKGFSEDTDRERPLDFYTETIHETLKALGVKEKVILAADQPSGLYAFDYMSRYPDEVAAFVGFNPYFPTLARRYLQGNFRNEDEYAWLMKRIPTIEGRKQDMLCATGYVKLQAPIYEYLFSGSGLNEEYDIMEEMFIRRYLKHAHMNELENLYENTKKLRDYKLPKDLPACILLADEIRKNKYYSLDWQDEYRKIITNDDLQKVSIIADDPYAVFYNPSIFAQKIENITEYLR